MAESNGLLWDKQPGPDWFPEDYLHEAGRQTHRDYLPSLSCSLSEDFQDYVIGTRDNVAHEEARTIRGARCGKKAHASRLVNQINPHISKRLSKETPASLKLDLEKAVSQRILIKPCLSLIPMTMNQSIGWREPLPLFMIVLTILRYIMPKELCWRPNS